MGAQQDGPVSVYVAILWDVGRGGSRSGTYIVPVKLQQFNSAAEPPAPLADRVQHILLRDGLRHRAEHAPLCRGVDAVPHPRRQLVPERAVDELGVALGARRVSTWIRDTLCFGTFPSLALLCMGSGGEGRGEGART